MHRHRPLDTRRIHGSGHGCCFTSALRRFLTERDILRDQGDRSLVAKLLVITAACLATVFVTAILIEAFDVDPDLRPDGAGDFTLTPHESPGTGRQPVGALTALRAVQGSVLTAGAHLVLRHRARSALAIDRLFGSPGSMRPSPAAGCVQCPGARPFLIGLHHS
jgi:hypothetical protein